MDCIGATINDYSFILLLGGYTIDPVDWGEVVDHNTFLFVQKHSLFASFNLEWTLEWTNF